MKKKFGIEFDGGEKYTGSLFEQEAPETCRIFWGALPFEAKIVHAAFTGFTLFFPVEFKVNKVENPFVCGGQPGDLFMNVYATPMIFEGKTPREEIIIPYSRTGMFWKWGGWLTSNYFGKLDQNNMNEFYQTGRRIKENGSEMIKISKA